MPLKRIKKIVSDLHLEHDKLRARLGGLRYSVKELESEITKLGQNIGEPDLGLRKENEALREILRPVLGVKFKKTNGMVATWFQEAKVKGQPSIRVFIKDYENASAAINAVEAAQRKYTELMGEPE